MIGPICIMLCSVLFCYIYLCFAVSGLVVFILLLIDVS